MESEDLDDKKSKDRFPAPIIIFLLSIEVYWLAFKFESSYLNQFGIPNHLINVSPNLILTVALIFSGFIMLAISTVNLVSMYWPKNPYYQIKIVRLCFFMIYPIFKIASSGVSKKDIILLSIYFLIVIFFELVWPLVVFHDVKGFKNKIVKDEQAEEEPRIKTIFGRILTSVGPLYYGVFIIFWIGTSLSESAGYNRAINQETFLVDQADSSVVVIRARSENFICARIDSYSKKINSIFVREPQGYQYVSKEIGPLNFK